MLDNAQVKHIKGEHAEYLTFPALDKYSEIGAAFAIKGDKKYHYEPTVDADYSGIAKELGIKAEDIIIPFQEHTATVAKYDGEQRVFKDTDGLLTNKNEVVLATKVADCISILLYDPTNRAIGNIHSGWRGTLQKIIINAIDEMKNEYGTNPKDLICVLCPSIRQDHFEVDNDVYVQFKDSFPQIIDKVVLKKDDKFYIDAVACNIWMLKQAGLSDGNIIDSGLCTVCHSDVINSYRGNIDSEKHYRNLALIWLK